MAFWGAVVKPGKPHAFVPPPEDWNLHLSQASQGLNCCFVFACYIDAVQTLQGLVLTDKLPTLCRDCSQAALEPTVKEGVRVSVAVKSDEKDDPIIVCTLTAGRQDTVLLDMFFSQVRI